MISHPWLVQVENGMVSPEDFEKIKDFLAKGKIVWSLKT